MLLKKVFAAFKKKLNKYELNKKVELKKINPQSLDIELRNSQNFHFKNTEST